MTDNDLLRIFREEAAQHLGTLNSALLQIEMTPDTDPTYRTALIEMNRVAHSLKGAARAVGYTIIETIAHYMEEVFASALNQVLKLTPDVCDTLYDGLDVISTAVDDTEPEQTVLAQVLARLERLIIAAAPPVTNSQQVTLAKAVTSDAEAPDLQPTERSEGAPLESQTITLRPAEETVRVTLNKLDRLMAEATELVVAQMNGEERQRTFQTLRREHARWQREWRTVRTAYIRTVRRLQENASAPPELPVLLQFLEANQRYLTETNRRLAHLAQSAAQDQMHLATLTDQLQNEISGMRLVPFDTIVGGFQRMVRDLGRDLAKQVQFEVHGAFVEVDKTVLDALKDPLMHLIRNALDHGIEAPQERERQGKSPAGRLEITVEQRGSEIVLHVTDDGQGIDVNKVRRSIVKNGLLTEAEANTLDDDAARFYIFHPGLSTSTTITALSGRGFGMDIVRDRVESLRGRVGVRSVLGQGTTVTINVPVSLTRIRCVLLQVGGQQFALPSTVITRMEKRNRDDIFTAEGQEMLIVNGLPVPFVSLSAVLRLPDIQPQGDTVALMVLQAVNRTIAFEVDTLLSEQELVLKSLGPELVRTPCISGAALLGTGEVIIILDANDLIRAASGAALTPRRSAPTPTPTLTPQRLRILVVDDSITTRTLEKNILETAGFQVEVAVDGSEAWAMLATNQYDLIISDVEMPKMNGLELTILIKSSKEHQYLPVILLTSLSKPEQREAGLRAGADAYLVKSQFDQATLLETIRAVV